MNILLLEDEPLTRKHIASEILRFDASSIVDECKNLDEVKERCASKTYDAAFLDIRIGNNIEGIEAAKTLRSRGTFNIVFITAFSDPEMVRNACGAEPRSYLTKPVSSSQLTATLIFLKNLEAKGPSIQGWLSEGLIYVDSCLHRALNKASELGEKAAKERVAARLAKALKDLETMRVSPKSDCFEDLVNDLSVALYTSQKCEGPQGMEVAELITLGVIRLKERAQSYLVHEAGRR